VCGCAYEDMEMHEMAHGLYNSTDTLLMEAEMNQQDADMDPANDWYPESAACTCCNGYRYACKSEQCAEMGGCTCLFSEEQLLPRLRELVQFCELIGRFPENPQEEERLLNKEQRDFFLDIRSDILVFVDTTPARVRTLATTMVQVVKEFPHMARKIVAYYKNRIGSSPELRRETEWKSVFRDALLGTIFEECGRLLNDEIQSETALPLGIPERVTLVSALFAVVYYYPQKSIFTLLKPLISPKMNTEVFCLACEQQAQVLKEYPDMWKQILSRLKEVKSDADDVPHLKRLEDSTV